jgi:hypothetical protein
VAGNNLTHMNFVLPVQSEGVVLAVIYACRPLEEILRHTLLSLVESFLQVSSNLGALRLHSQLNALHCGKYLIFAPAQLLICYFCRPRFVRVSVLFPRGSHVFRDCAQQRLLDIYLERRRLLHNRPTLFPLYLERIIAGVCDQLVIGGFCFRVV